MTIPNPQTNPAAPNWVEQTKPVVIIDGASGELISFLTNGGIPVKVGDSMLQIPAGEISGQSSINKFGSNTAIAADTTEDIWDGGGTYSFPSNANITHISQAADQVAMRGATIEVQGLDIDWNLLIQNVTLDAADTTTAVALDTALIRVYRMEVHTNTVADSNINLQDLAGVINYAIITTPNNQTQMAIYTIPNGKTGYMTNYYCHQTDETNQTPTSTSVKLWGADRFNNYEFQLKSELAIPEAGPGFQHNFKPYLKFTQRTDIKITAMPANWPVNVNGGFDLILVDN